MSAAGRNNRRNLRAHVYKRDKGLCTYCRKPVAREDMTLDHVIAKAKGGRSTRENCVLACTRCNTLKRDADANRLPPRLQQRLATLRERSAVPNLSTADSTPRDRS